MQFDYAIVLQRRIRDFDQQANNVGRGLRGCIKVVSRVKERDIRLGLTVDKDDRVLNADNH